MALIYGQGPVLNNVKWQLTSELFYFDNFLIVPFTSDPWYDEMWDMFAAGYYAVFTLVRETEEIDHEIVYAIDATFEPFIEVVRGQEGTDPQDWVIGDRVEMRLTRDTMRRHKEIGNRYLLTADGRLLTGVDDDILLGPEPALIDLY